ncbi:MAG: hypothetical protein ACRDWT_08985 [Jatrophihabitantaceae bacterium]
MATAAPERAGLLVAAAALVTLAACGSGTAGPSRSTSTGRAAAPAGFGWFAAGPAPADWRTITLPDGAARLSYPPSARSTAGDPGTVTAATGSADNPLIYLNATPRQGAETPANWSRFRVAHLADDDADSVALEATATGLAFRGGTGSCVIDHYRSRVGGHAYREIACLVTGRHSASVLIAATPTAAWSREATVIERAVDAYRVR